MPFSDKEIQKLEKVLNEERSEKERVSNF